MGDDDDHTGQFYQIETRASGPAMYLKRVATCVSRQNFSQLDEPKAAFPTRIDSGDHLWNHMLWKHLFGPLPKNGTNNDALAIDKRTNAIHHAYDWNTYGRWISHDRFHPCRCLTSFSSSVRVQHRYRFRNYRKCEILCCDDHACFHATTLN